MWKGEKILGRDSALIFVAKHMYRKVLVVWSIVFRKLQNESAMRGSFRVLKLNLFHKNSTVTYDVSAAVVTKHPEPRSLHSTVTGCSLCVCVSLITIGITHCLHKMHSLHVIQQRKYSTRLFNSHRK